VNKILPPDLSAKIPGLLIAKVGGICQNMLRGGFPENTIAAVIQALFLDQSAKNMQPAFGVFDPRGRGEVSRAEFAPAMLLMGEDIEESRVADLFIEFDADGSGSIDFDEFVAMMRKLNPLRAADRATKCDATTAAIVLDHDIAQRLHPLQKRKAGIIIKNMLKAGYQEYHVNAVIKAVFFGFHIHDPAWQAAWSVFDEDGSGAMDAKELKRAMKLIGNNVTAEKLDQYFVEADEDGSGEIDFGEFVTLIRKLHPKPSSTSLSHAMKGVKTTQDEFQFTKTENPNEIEFKKWLFELNMPLYFPHFLAARLMEPEQIAQMTLPMLARAMPGLKPGQRAEIFTKAEGWKLRMRRESSRLDLESAIEASQLRARHAVQKAREQRAGYLKLYAAENTVRQGIVRVNCATQGGPRYGGTMIMGYHKGQRKDIKKALPRSESTIPHNIPPTLLRHMDTPRATGTPLKSEFDLYLEQRDTHLFPNSNLNPFRASNPPIPSHSNSMQQRVGVNTMPRVCRPNTKAVGGMAPGWYGRPP